MEEVVPGHAFTAHIRTLRKPLFEGAAGDNPAHLQGCFGTASSETGSI